MARITEIYTDFILPVDRCHTVLFEILITTRELMLSKPATTISTQGRRVDTLKHQIARLVDHISLATGIAAPKHIYQVFTIGSQRLDGSIGKLLPAEGGMTVCLMGSDGE